MDSRESREFGDYFSSFPRKPESTKHNQLWEVPSKRGVGPSASRTLSVRIVCSALLALLLACGPAPEAHGARWYTVEMIVFERIGDENLHDEVWLADPGRPPIDESIELNRASGLALAEELEEGGSAAPYAFRLLDRGHFRLGGVFSRLRGSRDYRPLLHVAWHQPGYSRRRAKHAHIQGFRDAAGGSGAYSPGAGAWPVIDGTVQLYARRFLHLRADLLYYRRDPRSDVDFLEAFKVRPSALAPAQGTPEEPARTAEPVSAPSAEEEAEVSVSALPESASLGAGTAVDPDLVSGSGRDSGSPTAGGHRGVAHGGPPPVFRMTTSRRMRPGELHYLDHPLFGVLVIVSRYAPPSG